MDDVEEGAEEALQRPLSWVHAHGHRAEDTSDDKAVSRLRDVNELIIYTQRDGVWRLAVGYCIGRFLQANDLSVCELAAVVDEGHGAHSCTDVAWAARGLVNFPALDVDLDGVVAGQAAEEGGLHVWDDGRRADDEPLDADKLVRVCVCV